MNTIYHLIKGGIARSIFYPSAQKYLKRDVTSKINWLKNTYTKKYELRKKENIERLIDILNHCKKHVPYYRDLFSDIHFQPENIRDDYSYFHSLPYLTKEIIAEQGNRMLSDGFENNPYFPMKTGGSTGVSTLIYYDKSAMDWSSAITHFARHKVGHGHWKPEVHFASKFPEVFPLKARIIEQIKCFTMNRYNIFFNALDDDGLKRIWDQIEKMNPHLVHAHPSTIYALAEYVGRNYGPQKRFDIFESSGELLDSKKRKSITRNLQCKVIDRYGLAEFGVTAYQMNEDSELLQVLDTFVIPEHYLFDEKSDCPELVFTGLNNYLMPLVRYRTGDRGEVKETSDGVFIKNMTGRMHDIVCVDGVDYPTHYFQDVLDRIGGIKEFQFRLSSNNSPLMTLVAEEGIDKEMIIGKLSDFWPIGINYKFVNIEDLIWVGWRDKFRYVVEIE